MRKILSKISVLFGCIGVLMPLVMVFGAPRAVFLSFIGLYFSLVLFSPTLLEVFGSKKWADKKWYVFCTITVAFFLDSV